jgi:hypothetical protein
VLHPPVPHCAEGPDRLPVSSSWAVGGAPQQPLAAERAWAVGDFRAAVLAFHAARREVDQRQRPWHRALIAERAVKRDGLMTAVDLPALLSRAEKSAEEVLGRVHAAVPVLPPVPPGGFALIRDLASANLSA